MTQHHRPGPNLRDGIRDSLPRDVGGRAVDWLEHGRKFLFRIEIPGGRDTYRSNYGRTQVGENVAEKIGAYHNIKPVRVAHKVRRPDIHFKLVRANIPKF